VAAHDSYSSPLSERYASTAMLTLWGAQTRYSLWRDLWIALAESQKSLGIDIPDAAIEQLRDHAQNIDFKAVSEYERRFRHDVMAHVHAFGEVAPDARKFIHLGATSCYVTDNTELILMRRGLEILREKIARIVTSLSEFAREWRDVPALGYTHLQPAQLTTVGKRATLWMQDLMLDVADIEHRERTIPFRGVKGTTGTQASFLSLFDGDHEKVRELDRMVTARMGFSHAIPVSGQTYSRKIDAQVLGVVAGVAASASKFSGDMRMLQAFGEIEEPFEKEQIGSSAMAYKRNPMRSERIAALARFVLSLEPNANQTHAVQYFERTLDDSANRRLVIPESFLATDAILVLMQNVTRGLEVHPARIRRRVDDELPFMATEELIVRFVRAGGDRQEAHEIIRGHSIAASAAVKDGAPRNDMLERLAADAKFGIPLTDLQAAAEPSRYIGRAASQVDDFLAEEIEPWLSRQQLSETIEAVRV
jgi:adenylosuccinate lyase